MKHFLLVWFLFLGAFAYGQDVMVKDTFTSANNHKYVVTGFFIPGVSDISGQMPSSKGYYMTSMQMHDDWKYLTNSFAKEAAQQGKIGSVQDSVRLSLLEMVKAKDGQISSWADKYTSLNTYVVEKTAIYQKQTESLQNSYNGAIKANADLSLRLDKETRRKNTWKTLTLGAFLVGFISAFAIHH